MDAAREPRDLDDTVFLIFVFGWAGVLVLARILYLVVFEPALGESTYVYIAGKGSGDGFILATAHWSIALWAITATCCILAAITVPALKAKNAYSVAPGITALLLSGVTVTFMLGNGVLTAFAVPSPFGDVVSAALICGGGGVALWTLFVVPKRIEKHLRRRILH